MHLHGICEPCCQSGKYGDDDPAQVEGGVLWVEQLLTVVVVASVVAVAAIFGTLTSVLLPAVEVHAVPAFLHNPVAHGKRSLAQIASLAEHEPFSSHQRSRIGHDVLLQKQAIPDVGHCYLQHDIHRQCKQQGYDYAL